MHTRFDFLIKSKNYDYLIQHLTHVVDESASGRKYSAPILLMNTLGEGML